MNGIKIDISNYKNIIIKHLVLDYNGTLAKDGVVKDSVKKILPSLSEIFQLYVVTADTFGSVHKQLEGFNVSVKVLESDNHTLEKAEFIKTLGAKSCVAIGNGNNDAKMLEVAELGVAIVGDEGCATETLLKSDLLCNSIGDALELFNNPKRLIATLRR